MAMRSRTPWAVKLKPESREVVVDDPKGRGKMLVPAPLQVALELRSVKKGRVITVPALRDLLAKRFDADFTCPLVTGIFLNIIAGASEEAIAKGGKAVAPWWRVVDERGRLSEKTPPGTARQRELLEGEGHRVVPTARGHRWCVAGYGADERPGKGGRGAAASRSPR